MLVKQCHLLLHLGNLADGLKKHMGQYLLSKNTAVKLLKITFMFIA